MVARVLALALVGVIVAACTSESVDGPKLPRRARAAAADDDDDDVVAPTVDAGDGIAKPIKPGPVADSGPPPQSKACAVGELALCFTFEGSTTDTGGLKPTTLSNVQFVAGRENQAASFGPNSAMRYAPNAAFELPANATVEAWIKREPNTESAVIFDDDGRFSLTIDAPGNVLCKSSGGAAAGTGVVPVQQWAHVACVVDNGTLRAYLNGVEVASGPGAIGSAPTLGAAIGGNSPDGEPFIGVIDSLRIFKVARTAAQISEAAKP